MGGQMILGAGAGLDYRVRVIIDERVAQALDSFGHGRASARPPSEATDKGLGCKGARELVQDEDQAGSARWQWRWQLYPTVESKPCIDVGREWDTELRRITQNTLDRRWLARVEHAKSRVVAMHACPSTQTSRPVSFATHDRGLPWRLINRKHLAQGEVA
ncbi:hypothetical protein COCHEDRAFT_1205060 [Bipolaris maydis C5]|uniref:Uncharacterized protein n=1 Tax=Cochliobolus heterostrophus (strain C5 / ATCC 48332 / race O) TaxID=701091 RepID=M2URQ1_COCH5|nr:hypothetical protein COCHEDRAFT_1205060 [Bipolaris maydis C5]